MRIRSAARAVISVNGTLSRLRITTSDSTTCTWLSIRPGISVRPPQSMTLAVCKLDRFGRDFPDRVAFDDQFVAAAQFPGLGIEHFEILEMVDIHGPVSDRSRLD